MKEGTVGHVFENRYKSECIEDELYLIQVIRYVHNNPVKAKIVKKAKYYEWSSYKSYINNQEDCGEINLISIYFNNQIEKFIEYHNQEDDSEYLEIKEDLKKYREERAQKVIEKLCEKYQINSCKSIQQNPQLRDSIIVEIIEKSKLPYRKIAEIIGMSASSVYNINKRNKL